MPLNRQPPKVRSKIAAMGNAALRAQGKIYKLNSETAKAANLKSQETKRLNKLRKQSQENEEKERLYQKWGYKI